LPRIRRQAAVAAANVAAKPRPQSPRAIDDILVGPTLLSLILHRLANVG